MKEIAPIADKTIATINEDGFVALVEQFIERGEDRVTPQTFLQVMTDVAAQRSQREMELSGRVVNGEIIFDVPALLPVSNNTLYVGDTKVTLRLRMENRWVCPTRLTSSCRNPRPFSDLHELSAFA